jgi:hypothetical protein
MTPDVLKNQKKSEKCTVKKKFKLIFSKLFLSDVFMY